MTWVELRKAFAVLVLIAGTITALCVVFSSSIFSLYKIIPADKITGTGGTNISYSQSRNLLLSMKRTFSSQGRDDIRINNTRSVKNGVVSSSTLPKYSMFFDINKSVPYFYKVTSNHSTDRYRQKYELNFTNLDRLPKQDGNKTKLILFFNVPGWYDTALKECIRGLEMCPVKSCQCSTDHRNLSVADAVIIDAVELRLKNPPKKESNQVWIYFSLESPNYYYSGHYKSKQWREMFNWTMTYRRDSDIPIPYDILLRKQKLSRHNHTEMAAQKNKTALWLVSNCKTPGQRELYVKELTKFYKVDIFGRCGRRISGGTKSVLPKNLNSYRFYLAFENGFCFDYITEKLFKTYADDIKMIPIVRGGADYTTMLPEGTYINTASFSSAEKLGRYLKYLETNVTAYAELLRRKDEYVNEGNETRRMNGYCDICVKLHDLETFSNHYTNMDKWINQDTCHSAKDI